MNKLEKNIKKRTALRTATTRIIKKLETELNVITPNIELIEELFSVLTEKERDMLELNKEIEDDISDANQLEKDITSTENYKEEISICKTRVNRYLKQVRENKVQDNLTHSNSRTSSLKSTQVKLPRLVIEKFDGEIPKWPNFWSQFKTTIHENESLNDVEKFNYLKTYLTGDAEISTGGLSLTSENYNKAIEILKSRFGRKELQIDIRMSRLLNLTPCKYSKDITSLRRIYDKVNIEIQALASLGIEPNSYGALLFPILIRALPTDIALEFNRLHDTEGNKITDLLNFLKKKIESRERTFLLTKSMDCDNIYSKNTDKYVHANKQNKERFVSCENKKKNPRKQSTAATLNTFVDNLCVFCDKVTDHLSDDCNKFNIAQKKDILKRNGRCFLCYRKFHTKKLCIINVECNVCHKKQQHRKGLCEKAYPVVNESLCEQVNYINNSETVLTSVMPEKKEITNGKQIVFLQTFRAIVRGTGMKTKVRCLLNSGSQRTFVHENLSKKLNLPVIGKEKINLHTFGNNTAVNTIRCRVKFQLCNIENESKNLTIEALESPEICNALIEIPSQELYDQIQSLNIKLSDYEDGESNHHKIDILIGSDYFWEIVSGKTKRLSSSVMLIDTLMGWSIQGPVTHSSLNIKPLSVGVLNAVLMKDLDEDQLTSSQLKAFGELESLGIHNDLKVSTSDEEALRSFESGLIFKEGRYEVQLPWKHNCDNLENNYDNAKKRLVSLVRRFYKDPFLYADYKSAIEEYHKLGIVESVTEQNDTGQNPIYYLPHHPVIRKDKNTTKLRIVFDASSHPPRAPSLNELLHPGPNLNPDLLKLILKFRINRIAFIADIEKAFLQISLVETDRDVVRFLWIDDLPDNVSHIEPKILRMTRVLFGVTSSPFLLAAVIKFHLKQYFTMYPDTCLMLNESMYVDDLLSGAPNEEEAFRRSKEADYIIKEAGMKLRKWKSNSVELENLWSDYGFETSTSDNTDISSKVLGMLWDTQKDVFKFDVKNLLNFVLNSDDTKRTIIRTAGRIFDPVGFLSPFTIRLKLIFQELWERGIHWDEELPEELKETWKSWCSEVELLKEFSVPRKYFPTNVEMIADALQLHIFCDASPRAYGAVAYLRFQEGENISTSFVMAKTRVSPLKKLTLPRLELMSAVIAARIADYLKDVFEVSNILLWSDSSITLHWIKGTVKDWKPFVSNRVAEIKNYTDPQNWNHCKGTDNPADILTKGKNVSKLMKDVKWWQGPPWLMLPDCLWPRSNLSEVNSEDLKTEKKTTVQFVCNVTPTSEPVLDIEKYSKLSRLYRVIAWIKRFIHNARKFGEKKEGPLAALELAEVELYWVKTIQSKYFEEERNQLLNDQPIARVSKLIEFDPELDENKLICIKGRLQFSKCEMKEKHPWLIPGGNKYAELLIMDAHNKVLHSGIADTLAELRSKFWILRGKQNVKSVLNKCLICRRYKVRPAVQVTAPLPADRVQESPPFDVIGIDFAGPLFTRENKEKHYILLCTCAVTRAIHLELVPNLSTETFLLAFRRFISRRGICSTIYSDNAKTFKRADLELKEIWKKINHLEIRAFFGKTGIHWKFIVERGAWWGGFYERIVKTVKTCLKKIIGKSSLSTEELRTVLTEIEAVINSRPITYVYSNSQELSPLSLSHFLVGKRLISLPPVKYDGNVNADRNNMIKRYNYRQKLLDHYWKRWKSEYLLNLKSANCITPTKVKGDFKVNDVVLIGDNKLPRNMWNLGKIVETYTGRDGKIRSCSVKLKSGIVKRPIQLLYPLELSE